MSEEEPLTISSNWIDDFWTPFGSAPLVSFSDMWKKIFLWALVSSVTVHTMAALIAFASLRKHRMGRFYPILIFLDGIFTPVTSGALTSAVIAFVYRASSQQMTSLYAFVYGVVIQTVLGAAFSFTRILATL